MAASEIVMHRMFAEIVANYHPFANIASVLISA